MKLAHMKPVDRHRRVSELVSIFRDRLDTSVVYRVGREGRASVAGEVLGIAAHPAPSTLSPVLVMRCGQEYVVVSLVTILSIGGREG